MYGPRKPAHWAMISFTAVAVLVLGGLSWATVASLQLEQKTLQLQQVESRNNDVSKALWRIHGLIVPVLGREISRPYYEYSSYYIPQTLHWDQAEPAVDVLQESPLLDTSTLEPWILLHFQYTDPGQWTSPQLPEPHRWEQIESFPPATPGNALRRQILERLEDSDGTKRFAEAIEKATHNPDQVKLVSLPSARRPGDFGQRLIQIARLQESNVPKLLECEPVSNVSSVLGQQTQQAPEPSAENEGFTVRVSELTPLWLDLKYGDGPFLVFVRRVRVGVELAYQGFVADWRALANTLLASAAVADLFEEATLEPVFEPGGEDRATELGTLPLKLTVSGPKSAPGHISSYWTSTRMTVAFAWVTALIALAALGFGVRGLVALTARRTEFTYAVTHELRTPLTTFQLYTDMLASGLVPEEKRAAYLLTLNEESRRLSELVAEVLEFSRIENNAVRTNPGSHSVMELLDTVRERYASRCAAAGVRLALDPNGSADHRVHTDLHIAQQIVGTLIDNACKYASAPADRAVEPPQVSISAHPGAHKLAIDVADNGPGIPPEDRHHLFKPFHRGSRAQTTKVGGVGLGLALAKRWSRLIHGDLELVDQGTARGTRFRLTLPAEC